MSHGAEVSRLDAMDHGAEVPGPSQRGFCVAACVAKKKGSAPQITARYPWRRGVIPRRHDSWRRPPRSISAFKFSRGPIVKFFQKKGQIVKNWAMAVTGEERKRGPTGQARGRSAAAGQ